MQSPIPLSISSIYWSCGIREHKHTTRKAAYNCLCRQARRQQTAETTHNQKVRNIHIVSAFFLEEATVKDLAAAYGLSENRVKQIIQREVRNAIRRQRLCADRLGMPGTTMADIIEHRETLMPIMEGSIYANLPQRPEVRNPFLPL